MEPPYSEPKGPMQAAAMPLADQIFKVPNGLGDIYWHGVGPQHVPILIRRDGLVIFDFENAEDFASPAVPGYQPSYGKKQPPDVVKTESKRTQIAYTRIDYINAWFAGYMSAVSSIQKGVIAVHQPADPSHHFKAVMNGGCWVAFAVGGENFNLRNIESEISIPAEVFEYAIDVMSASQSAFGQNYTVPLALVYQACFQYRMHQFSSAHITAWSIAEVALNKMWEKLQQDAVQNSVTRISKHRRKQLNGRDFTASVITQLLSLNGQITDQQLERLDAARKTRNNFAHLLVRIEAPDASAALSIALEMLSEVLKIILRPALSYRLWH